MANPMDKLWHKLKVAVGSCAQNADVDTIKDYLEKGEQAAKVGALLDKDPRRIEKLTLGAENLGKLRGAIETTQNVCLDLKAINQIHEAIKVLNQPGVVAPGSKLAAQAFGQLFVGAGRFASKLPPPANAYAQFLKGCGDFFVNMQGLLDPEGPHPHGRQMREILREIDGQGR